MRNSVKTISLVMAVLFSSSTAFAEGSWWQKGMDLLKSSDEAKPLSESVATVLGDGDISAAFKEALRIGSNNVVKQLGSEDGFNADPAIHIPLPAQLVPVKKLLGKVGMTQVVDDLELKLNRAAEAATPKAKALFLESINQMTFDDVKTIYEGPEDSATQYFKQKMSPELIAEMRPIIENSLSEVGAVKAYDNVIGNYQQLPFVPDVKANLIDHVVDLGMEGIFHYIAEEEAAIRKDPVKQSTELLKKVFGAK